MARWGGCGVVWCEVGVVKQALGWAWGVKVGGQGLMTCHLQRNGQQQQQRGIGGAPAVSCACSLPTSCQWVPAWSKSRHCATHRAVHESLARTPLLCTASQPQLRRPPSTPGPHPLSPTRRVLTHSLSLSHLRPPIWTTPSHPTHPLLPPRSWTWGAATASTLLHSHAHPPI